MPGLAIDIPICAYLRRRRQGTDVFAGAVGGGVMARMLPVTPLQVVDQSAPSRFVIPKDVSTTGFVEAGVVELDAPSFPRVSLRLKTRLQVGSSRSPP